MQTKLRPDETSGPIAKAERPLLEQKVSLTKADVLAARNGGMLLRHPNLDLWAFCSSRQ
jgi:hypothetical protein